jgi:hypothetical protein
MVLYQISFSDQQPSRKYAENRKYENMEMKSKKVNRGMEETKRKAM